MGVVKFGLPDRVHTMDDLLGAVRQMDGVQNIVVVVEDGEGVVMLALDGITSERLNWMLDRAKLRLHRAD